MQVLSNNETEGSAGKYVLDKTRSYLSYWPLFLVTLLLSFGLALTYLKIKIPLYESSATILINESKKRSISWTQEAFGVNNTNKVMDNELAVLTSRTVMREVVKKLALYAPVYKEEKFRSVPAYALSPVRVELRDPESLKEYDKVYFDYDAGKRHVTINQQWYPLNQWITTEWGTLRFTPNRRYRQAPGNQQLYFSLTDIKKVTGKLLDNLTVATPGKESTIVNLRLYDAVPARAEDVLNELIKVYSNADIKDKSTRATKALAIAEDRLHYVVRDLDSIEGALQQFKASEGVIDISEQGKLYLKSVEMTDMQVSDINDQLAVLNQVEKYLTGRSESAQAGNPGGANAGTGEAPDAGQPSGAAGSESVRQYKTGNPDNSGLLVPSTLGLHNTELLDLLQRLYDTELQYARLIKNTAKNSPVMISLQNQLDRLRPSILENIRNQRLNLNATRKNMESTGSSYSTMLSTLPEKERRLLDITRQQAIKNNIYTFLLQKREEAALAVAASVSDNRLIDSADSNNFPVSPKRPLIYAVALLIGLGIPFSFASFRESVNKTIRSKADITALSSFPVMGEIAFNKSKNPLVISDGERSYVAEQFRQVRTALSFAGIHEARNKLLVTSSVAGEGKTFIAANLAISLALTDKKVVLLELDLRKPQLSRIFNTSGHPGMSEYLSGKAGIKQVVCQTTLHNNLYLVPAGAVPGSPSELIMNGRLGELISELEKTYDYIIMETAPVSAVTDAFVVGGYCNVTLFVIRHGYTRKEDLKRMEENVILKGMSNISVIFNAVKTAQLNKNAYYYYEAKENKAGTRRQSGQTI